jgi:hypothetical protein
MEAHETPPPPAAAAQQQTQNLPPPRLVISEMVLENFKSYAGEQRVGPFHKVCLSVVRMLLLKGRKEKRKKTVSQCGETYARSTRVPLVKRPIQGV